MDQGYTELKKSIQALFDVHYDPNPIRGYWMDINVVFETLGNLIEKATIQKIIDELLEEGLLKPHWINKELYASTKKYQPLLQSILKHFLIQPATFEGICEKFSGESPQDISEILETLEFMGLCFKHENKYMHMSFKHQNENNQASKQKALKRLREIQKDMEDQRTVLQREILDLFRQQNEYLGFGDIVRAVSEKWHEVKVAVNGLIENGFLEKSALGYRLKKYQVANTEKSTLQKEILAYLQSEYQDNQKEVLTIELNDTWLKFKNHTLEDVEKALEGLVSLGTLTKGEQWYVYQYKPQQEMEINQVNQIKKEMENATVKPLELTWQQETIKDVEQAISRILTDGKGLEHLDSLYHLRNRLIAEMPGLGAVVGFGVGAAGIPFFANDPLAKSFPDDDKNREIKHAILEVIGKHKQGSLSFVLYQLKESSFEEIDIVNCFILLIDDNCIKLSQRGYSLTPDGERWIHNRLSLFWDKDINRCKEANKQFSEFLGKFDEFMNDLVKRYEDLGCTDTVVRENMIRMFAEVVNKIRHDKGEEDATNKPVIPASARNEENQEVALPKDCHELGLFVLDFINQNLRDNKISVGAIITYLQNRLVELNLVKKVDDKYIIA